MDGWERCFKVVTLNLYKSLGSLLLDTAGGRFNPFKTRVCLKIIPVDRQAA